METAVKSADVPSPGETFSTFEELCGLLKDLSVRQGFICSRNTKMFHAQPAKELFNLGADVKIVQRGYFYCAYKDAKAKHDATIKTTCRWRVPFTYDRVKRKYFIKSELYEASHNHVHGLTKEESPINREKKLQQSEIDQITSLAMQGESPIQVRQTMHEANPGREYTIDLIRRVIRSSSTPPSKVPSPIAARVETTDEERYVALHQHFNKLVARVIHDPSLYRLFTLNLIAFEQSLPTASEPQSTVQVASDEGSKRKPIDLRQGASSTKKSKRE
ncbi:hypothetical protein AC1031_016002 [Aphanomyces cochlioides]|nr:hypothetical protein AC1031_016002 [Aphanomyces cochlioides]